jgi:hypothetical protein
MIRTTLMLSIFLCGFSAHPALAENPCTDAVRIVDKRGEDDSGYLRVYCVKFVLARWHGELTHGWLEWQDVVLGEAMSSHRLGLFPADIGFTMVFGRLPGRVAPGPGTTSVSVLLDGPRWWLVNVTRHGWQLRSGTISHPGMHTLRKLFNDVALNAGIAETGEQLEDWWPGGL